jgi:triacylglycerol lipase
MKVLRTLLLFIFTMLMIASLSYAVEIGPNPTSTLLNGDGPFSVSSSSVSSFVSGFGGGTIYYPTTSGQYGAIAVCPGFTGTSSSIAWFARRLATHGFVTIAMNTNSTMDYPDSRATQLAAALRYLLNSSSSTIQSRIRSADRGVAGHSMGGGGTLRASESDSTLRVGIPLTPWHTDKTWGSVRVPQLIIGADGDTVAPASSHARTFYNSLSYPERAYALLNSATHFTPNSTDERIGRYGVAFAKRFVDGDTRYEPFLCGAEHSSYATSWKFDTYLSTCPYDGGTEPDPDPEPDYPWWWWWR